jgi:hypothetical protein
VIWLDQSLAQVYTDATATFAQRNNLVHTIDLFFVSAAIFTMASRADILEVLMSCGKAGKAEFGKSYKQSKFKTFSA